MIDRWYQVHVNGVPLPFIENMIIKFLKQKKKAKNRQIKNKETSNDGQ